MSWIKKAIVNSQKYDLKILHFSVQSNHIHLIIEVESSEILTSAMKSFCRTLSGKIRANSKHKVSKIFKHRHHTHTLKTPREVKLALKYVLMNGAKHLEKLPFIDLFSSSSLFQQWAQLFDQKIADKLQLQSEKIKEKYHQYAATLEELTYQSATWLGSVGWLYATG